MVSGIFTGLVHTIHNNAAMTAITTPALKYVFLVEAAFSADWLVSLVSRDLVAVHPCSQVSSR